MPSKRPESIAIDDVLPPGKAIPEVEGQSGASPLAQILARLLDDFFRIPGTKFRIGLDPILASSPIFGDMLAAGPGLVILLEAIRSRVSLPVLLRMGGNMLINTTLDVIPIIGPVGSAFFKSNTRNLRLLQKWQAGQQRVVQKSTTRLFVILAFIVAALIAIWITAGVLLVRYLWNQG